MQNREQTKNLKRERRHAKIRFKISGTKERPRLSVFKSNKYLYAQVIDDSSGTTIVSASNKDVAGKKTQSGSAKELGKTIASKALAKKVKKVVFDRGGYIYTGQIKLLAEGAREGGLSL